MPHRLPSRGQYLPAQLATTLFRDEVEDDAGAFVVVEMRRLGPRVYETTIAPGYAPDPDGPEVALCATVRTRRTAAAAHAQAVDFATRALTSTVRPQE